MLRNELSKRHISFDQASTVWLGHDRISSKAAIAAAQKKGGRSAVIHHMSYAAYESYAENSGIANRKEREQREIFQQCDLALAVGPLLRDALHDIFGGARPVAMLVPGLAEIPVREGPRTFTVFLSGRLSPSFSTGGADRPGGRMKWTPRPTGLHYKWVR